MRLGPVLLLVTCAACRCGDPREPKARPSVVTVLDPATDELVGGGHVAAPGGPRPLDRGARAADVRAGALP